MNSRIKEIPAQFPITVLEYNHFTTGEGASNQEGRWGDFMLTRHRWITKEMSQIHVLSQWCPTNYQETF